MTILFVLSHPDATSALSGLSAACRRKGQSYALFFTGDGVSLLRDKKTLTSTSDSERAVVCEYSWNRYFQCENPPIEQGSQTDLSAMIGTADKVVSL